MANITLAQPEGILEDVLIKVGKFILLVELVVIDIEEDKQVPLLLGRPFLAIGATLIDVKNGELTLRVGDEAVIRVSWGILNQQNLYLIPPTTVALLLQYSGSRIVHRDGFSL